MLFVPTKRGKKPPRAAEGFNLACANLLFVCADSRFAKPQSSLQGRTGCHFLHRAKSNQKARGTPSCDLDSKLCRKRFCKAFRRHVSKPVLLTKRRRKGFESVQKGYRSADARPLFFEKELLYCKLTVASDIRKGLLHVSFGAVRSCCRGALRKSFSLSVNFA